jgi:hypothetical protein
MEMNKVMKWCKVSIHHHYGQQDGSIAQACVIDIEVNKLIKRKT